MDDLRTDRAAGVRFRKVRIAWSVGCGIIWLLLIVLWVRSSYFMDQVYAPTSKASHLYLGSKPGQLQVGWTPIPVPGRTHRMRVFSIAIADLFTDDESADDALLAEISGGPFGRTFYLDTNGFIAPYWFLVFVCGFIAAAPWLRLRFSLRTLLIATTLVAVLLGAVIWAVR